MDHHTKEEIALTSKWRSYLGHARNLHESKLQERVSSASGVVSDFKSFKASLDFNTQIIERNGIKDEPRRRMLERGLRKLEN